MTRLLQTRGLSFSYGIGPVLSNIDLSLDAGEIVAILGPNGSGKSTLIKCLTGYLTPQGQTDWEGRPLAQWKRRDLARRLAYLPQAPTWEPEQRVLDVLRLGRAPYWKAFGLESQRDIDVVHDVARSLGLTDLLSRRLDEISGGQRQRALLGRCLVQEPTAMLLDEPNTFLDLKHQVELGELLRRLAAEKRMAVLMASHDLNLAAAAADRLLLLSEGRIAAAGTPRDVLRNDILRAAYGVEMNVLHVDDGTPVVVPVMRR